MSRIIVVLAGLVCSLLVTPHSAAGADREHRVTLDRPRSSSSVGHVSLKGRVSDARGRVVLQRSADGRWVNLRTVPVRNHAYLIEVATRPRQQRFRVRAGSAVSQTRVVRAARPTATQDACGPRPRKPDGSRWSCTFVDDFDATQLNRDRWLPHQAAGNNTCYRDHPDNIDVASGTLRLTATKLPRPAPCGWQTAAYAVAQVSTYRRFSQRYGRFEARFKNTATSVGGLHEAFWLWPDDRQHIPVPWPASGEIDIVETYSANSHLAIPFLHYTWNDNGGPVPGVNTAWDCHVERGVFNTYTLEWSERRIEIFVNGDSCLVNTSGDEAFKRRFIVNLTQALGVQGNSYDGRAPLPATMTVDYVRVWR